MELEVTFAYMVLRSLSIPDLDSKTQNTGSKNMLINCLPIK